MPEKTLLDVSIIGRHSTRGFLPTPVPRAVLERALGLAQHSPSNSNIQPWRVIIASGAARDRTAAALSAAASQGEAPKIPPLPDDFRHYRSDLGRALYGGAMGIAREDAAGRRAAQLRNFDFFGAPAIAVVAMDGRLGAADSLSVGMFLQLLLLALAEDGVGSCVEMSVAGYPEILRRELGIAESMEVICGVAMGYPAPEHKGNAFRAEKEPIDTVARFVET